MKKVLLIEPPFQRFMGFKCDWFSLGLGYIASVLQSKGFPTRIYNSEFHTRPQYLKYTKLLSRSESYCDGLENKFHPVWTEIRKVIDTESPDVVGIAVKTIKVKSAQRVAEICKSINEDIVVVAGGPHCTILPEEMMADKNIDYVVRGEGELTMIELLESLEGRKSLENINGLSFRKNSKILHNSNRPLVNDLDKIPFPAKDCLINSESYDNEAVGNIISNRGCPFDCGYCAAHITWTRKVRYRSVANVLKEITLLMDSFGTRQFTFWDDSFTLNKKRIIELCKVLSKEKLGIKWGCNTRFDLLDEEIIGYMKEGGCNNIELGVESGSSRILKLIRKDISIEKMYNVADILRKYNLYWSAFFMVGLPTETPGDIKMTIDLMWRLKPNYATFSIYTPYPGTELYEVLLKEGIITKSMEWHLYSHQSKNNNFTGIIDNEKFKDIVDEVSRAFDSYNNSLSNIVGKALSKSTIYLHDPVELLRDAKRYLNYIGISQERS